MATDELIGLRELLQTNEPTGLDVVCRQIKSAWLAVYFSDLGQPALRRYADYHLEGITNISDTLSADSPAAEAIVELTGYLLQLFAPYIDQQLQAPRSYTARCLKRLLPLITELSAHIESSNLPVPLKNCLQNYLVEMSGSGDCACFTFGALDYFGRFLQRLTGPLENAAINRILEQLNFNHLSYISYRREQLASLQEGLGIAERLDLLSRLLQDLIANPAKELRYHPDWPDLAVLLARLIQEEINALGRQAIEPVAEKIALEISVAQLALWIKLFYGPAISDKACLSQIFRFISAHFRSKRQDQISAASLSKEYYSVTQVTAATVRGELQKMISRIDRDFFPV